jgi:Helicase conserved C-terminal domain/SNF2-related domain
MTDVERGDASDGGSVKNGLATTRRRRRPRAANDDPYRTFLAGKGVRASAQGIKPKPMHRRLFPFQADCVAWGLELGRAAFFEDTGLGKTVQEIEWARQIAERSGGKVLIFAPLAVAHQTIREASSVDVPVAYVRDQDEAAAADERVVITNYDRLDRFTLSEFKGVVLDEASILKAFMGKTKRALVERCQSVPYRLACTATPAPNDHMEIGNHSEFLGVLDANEMLTRWFINDTSLFGNYRLKGHAVAPFWDWVISWARCVGKPSDLGYSDEGFILPDLRHHYHVIGVDVTEGRGDALFRIPEMSATSVHAEKRRTAAARAGRIGELVAAEPAEQWTVWCDTDYEADHLTAEIPDAVEVRGTMKLEEKEARLVDFIEGRARVLVTKPSVAGMGLNLQRCARTAFVGLSFSYEQLYQAIRRHWRFGQKRPVDVHIAMAETERHIADVVMGKARGHEAMKEGMFAAMRRARAQVSPDDIYNPTHDAPRPAWLATR